MEIFVPEFFLLLKKIVEIKYYSSKLNKLDNKLLNNLIDDLPNLIDLMNNQSLNEYIKKVVNFSFEANKYFNDSEPWAVKKKDQDRMNSILFTIIQQIKNISILLNPIIPTTTAKVLNAMNISPSDLSFEMIRQINFDHKKELKNLDILFTKIEDDN